MYGHAFKGFDAQAGSSSTELKTVQTWSAILIKPPKIVKFRISQNNCNREDFIKFIIMFLNDFDQKVIHDSVTRTKKFTNKTIPPMIFSQH
jgi:hypothetical protein